MKRNFVLKYILVTLTLLACLSCKERNVINEAQGFWVYSDSVHGKHYSLSIKDSTIDVNSFGAVPYQLAAWPSHDSIEAHWPFDGWDINFHLLLRNDTLFRIQESSDTQEVEVRKYIREDSIELFPELLFGDEDLVIVPPSADSALDQLVSIKRKSLVSHIFLGRLKKQMREQHPKINADSIVVKVVDVLIGLPDLEYYLLREQDKLPETIRDSLTIQLNIDRSVPQSFVGQFRERIRKSHAQLRVCRATVDWNRHKLILRNLP
jgi:hypothetical protein